jgi:hypothetical protein
VPTVNLGVVTATWPMIVTKFRSLPIGNEGVCVGGELRQGVRLTEGVHGHVGARYRIVMDRWEPPPFTAEELRSLDESVDHVALRQRRLDESKANGTATHTVEVVDFYVEADTPREFVLLLTCYSWSSTLVRLRVVASGTPCQAEWTSVSNIDGSRLVRGPLRTTGTLALPGQLMNASTRGRAAFTMKHPRARAKLAAELGPRDGRYADLSVRVEGHGRGILRPVVAVVWWLARRRVRREFERWLDGLQRRADDVILAPPDATPEEIAAVIVNDVLEQMARAVDARLEAAAVADATFVSLA